MKSSILLVLIIWFVITGCEKIANETDPAKIIIGKWKAVELGNWPNMWPVQGDDYWEYLKDSVKIEYSPDSQPFQKIYWIDTLLHERLSVPDNRWLNMGFKYEFYDKNQKLRLDNASGIMEYSTVVLKRIR